MPRKAIVVLFFLLSPLSAAKKQPPEQAVVSWYEGTVRDWYGGSCAYHPDGRHHSPIGIHGCWRNLVVLKQSDTYLTMEDHCATPWKFQVGETVEFQRDIKYPRKIYLNRHVYALTQESSSTTGLEHTRPMVHQNPDPSLRGGTSPIDTPPATVSTQNSSHATLGLSGSDWEEDGVAGVQIRNLAENGSAALAGLHEGDVITELNGKKLRSAQDLSTLLEQLEPGSRVTIGYFIKTNLGWMPKEASAILAKGN